jgi:mannose-1-phosphate guanylyltransferase
MIVPIILSGGSGARLWPMSRALYPKQFLSLINKTSLFQDTINRLPEHISDPLIICNEEHRFIVAEQLRQISCKNKGIILEPIGKNTAPAIALAAFNLLNNNEDPTLLVLSADHLIDDNESFHKAVDVAIKEADKGKLVALGVPARKPETGYGYILTNNSKQNDYYNIKSFTEKPSKEDAQKYVDSGKYFWNTGIFIFKASVFLNELKKYDPKIYSICKKSCNNMTSDQDFIRPDNKEFIKCPSNSIDYAVMEKTIDSSLVPLGGHWSDIGSWEALWESKSKDINNNVIEGDIMLDKVKNSYIYSNYRFVSVNDFSDLIIIDTPDALLVSSKKNSQKIKKIVEKLNTEKRVEHINNRKVYRPWGYFDSIDSGNGFQVKRIFVNPGAKLSLQKHHKRSEHWVVVKGKAVITCGKKVFTLNENQSTYIPKDEVHRLENCESMPLEIIEIQTGSYLGEDDIIRLEDDYKRN